MTPPASQRPRVVALAVLEEWGGLVATLRIAKEFRHRGYRVVYLFRPPRGHQGDASDVRHPARFVEFLDKVGFEVGEVPIPDLPGGLVEKARGYRNWFAELLDLTTRLLRDSGVDLLLLQPPLSYPFSLAALDLGVPTVLLNPTLQDFARLDVPPIDSWRPPPQNPWSQARNALLWGWRFLSYQARLNTRPIVLATRLLRAQRPARELLRRHGLEFRFAGDGVCLDLPLMKIGPREFDFAPGPSYSYLGANIDLNRPEETWSWTQIEPSQKVVYCTLGEYGDHMAGGKRFLATVLRVARARPDLHFVIPTGNLVFDRDRLANVTVSRWVPQLETLRRSSLTITCAGFGTIKESVAMGVPMIVAPFIHDQPGNAARVVYHGLGVRADPRRVSPQGLESLIDQVLGSDRIRARVEAMRPHFLDEGPLRRGVDLLEEIVRDPGKAGFLTWRERKAGGRSGAALPALGSSP